MPARRLRLALAAAAAVAAVTVLLPAAADWLVTRDGERIETRGPWRVESRLVVFTQPDGTLASMRASEIDLEASRRATEAAAAEAAGTAGDGAAPAEPPEAPRSVLRLTEKELPPVPRDVAAAPAAPAGSGGEEAAATPAEPSVPSLEIVSWRDLSDAGAENQEFLGVIRNNAEHTAVGVKVSAVLYDYEGEPSVATEAVVTTRALPPGQSTNFRATFPGRHAYSRAEFTVEGQLVLSGPQGEEDDE